MGRYLDRSEARGVRHPETIKAYSVGRFVDPNRRKVMHEAHMIYRVESTPAWNLANPNGVPSLTTRQTSASALSTNEMVVELNRQREATKAVTQSGKAVSSKLAELTTALQQNQALAEQNATIRKELQTTRERMETLERKVNEQPAPKTSPSVKEEPW